jgi:hypothetical protein
MSSHGRYIWYNPDVERNGANDNKNFTGKKQMKYCIIDCGEGIHIHTRRRRSNLSDRRAGMTIIRHGEFFGTTIDRRDALRMVRAARRAGVAKLFRD